MVITVDPAQPMHAVFPLIRGIRTRHRGHTDIVVSESDRVSVRWMQGHEIGVPYMNDGLTN